MIIKKIYKFLVKRYGKVTNFDRGLIFLFLTWGLYFIYTWPQVLFEKPEGIFAGSWPMWGDTPVHFSYASVFAYRDIGDWFISHPLFYYGKFTYPFIADAITGFTYRLTSLSYVDSFTITSILTTLLFLYYLYYFIYQQVENYKISLLAITLFLASGGIGFVFFINDFLQDPAGVLNFPPQEYTHIVAENLHFINIVLSEILPQRAFLLGMALTLMIINVLHYWKETKFEKVKIWEYIVVGMFSGLMLIVHSHSFLVLILVSILFLLSTYHYWKNWLIYAVIAGATAIPLFYKLHYGELENSFVRWHVGWMSNSEEYDISFIEFWIRNWGLFLPLAIWSSLRVGYFKNPLFISGTIVFVLCNLFSFQPNLWDNTKLLSWTYLFYSIPIAIYLNKIFQKDWRYNTNKILVGVTTVILCFSGAIDLYRLARGHENPLMIYSREEIDMAQAFTLISDPSDVVLTSDQHNHWVVSLTGRRILMGYRGWLWTYGIDSSGVERDVRYMLEGMPNAGELFEKYSIDYVVIGRTEKEVYFANEKYFNTNYPIVLENSQWKVYKIDN